MDRGVSFEGGSLRDVTVTSSSLGRLRKPRVCFQKVGFQPHSIVHIEYGFKDCGTFRGQISCVLT